jgi:hypothetical protein
VSGVGNRLVCYPSHLARFVWAVEISYEYCRDELFMRRSEEHAVNINNAQDEP